MGAQTAELFIHIGFLNKQSKFLLQAVVIDVADGFCQTGFDFVHMRLQQAWEQLVQSIHNLFHTVQTLQQMFAQLFAFAFAGGCKLFQRAGQ